MDNLGKCSHCFSEFDMGILAAKRPDASYKCPFCSGVISAVESALEPPRLDGRLDIEVPVEFRQDPISKPPLEDRPISPTEAAKLTPAENSALVLVKPYVNAQLRTVDWGSCHARLTVSYDDLEEAMGTAVTARLARAFTSLYEREGWFVERNPSSYRSSAWFEFRNRPFPTAESYYDK